MAVFYILILCPLVIQHIRIKGIDYQRKNRFAMWFFFAFLFLLLACRHRTIGNDTSNYTSIFRRLARQPWNTINNDVASEYGFFLLCKLISIFSNNSQLFFAATAALCILPIARSYMRSSEDAMLTILVFCICSVFVMLFSGIRQALSMSFGLLAYECVRNRKPVSFILAVLAAYSFHNSALVLVVLYPLYYAKITQKWLYVVIPVMLLIYIFNEQIFGYLQAVLIQFTRFDIDSAETGAYTMLLLFVIFAIFAYVIPDEEKMDEETIGLRNIMLLVVALQMFASVHVLAMRVNYYFIMFVPMLIPRVIHSSRKSFEQVAWLARDIMVVVFLLYFFVILAPSGALHVFPYHFFWENLLW